MVTKAKPGAITGRPTAFRNEYAEQAAQLCDLGATESEIDWLFTWCPSPEDFLFYCLIVIRQDRLGIRSKWKADRQKQINKKRQSNPSMRIANSVRSRIWAALRGKTEKRLWSRLGYSVTELVSHLQGLFLDGMSWENYGAWHVDHKKPCSSFDLTDSVQFSECWSLSNLQPLWAADNLKKGARHDVHI